MSVNVEDRVIPPGSDGLIDAAWELKERIRREEDVLKQRWDFFADAYRRSTVYCFVEDHDEEELVGFAAVRRDGYLLFLAVDPDRRERGIGQRLVARVVEDNDALTCHARTTNETALQFYERLGFEIVRRIDTYYEDGGDAYYLKLGRDGRLTDRLAGLLGR